MARGACAVAGGFWSSGVAGGWLRAGLTLNRLVATLRIRASTRGAVIAHGLSNDAARRCESTGFIANKRLRNEMYVFDA
jgi:hypothetical protein